MTSKIETRLTSREQEIVDLILEEKTSTEIASDLGIREKTVESHRRNIYLKMGVKSAVGLVKQVMINRY